MDAQLSILHDDNCNIVNDGNHLLSPLSGNEILLIMHSFNESDVKFGATVDNSTISDHSSSGLLLKFSSVNVVRDLPVVVIFEMLLDGA